MKRQQLSFPATSKVVSKRGGRERWTHWTHTVDRMYESLVAAELQKTGESIPLKFIQEAITMMNAPGAPTFHTVRTKRIAITRLAHDLMLSSQPRLKKKKVSRARNR